MLPVELAVRITCESPARSTTRTARDHPPRRQAQNILLEGEPRLLPTSASRAW
jgi:hypothetical protein